MTVDRLTKLIKIAILSAMAYVLTLIAVPIVPIAPYLKLDLSDLPVLIGTVTLGITSGIAVAALTTALHLLMTGFALPSLIGAGVMFISSVIMLLTVGSTLKLFSRNFSLWGKVLMVAMLTINLTVMMALVNWLAIPFYMRMIGMTIQLPITKIIEFGIVPFNVVKGALIGTLFLLIYRYLRRSKRLDK